MTINEDKFANKSAEEIISDMLTQHKNNSKEALDHIQDILKDDGLTLSKDVKANLEKAASILSDKGLKEGWFSKPLPKESVVFEVYLPFKKEPAQFQIPPVSSLDDPLVTDTIQKIRKRHPHSTIYLRSKLGNKTITEEKGKKTPGLMKQFLSSNIVKDLAAIGLTAATGGAVQPMFGKPITNAALKKAASKFENVNDSYTIKLYNESNTYTCSAGSLPIALTLIENANGYVKADVLFNNVVLCSYDRVLKEWSTIPNEKALKEDIYTDDDITNNAYVDFKKDIADIDERTKLILCYLNPNLIDKRKPKWHNTLLDTPKIVNVDNDTKGEVYIVLDGVENEVNKENPDQTEVTIREKIPNNITAEGNLVYKDGEAYVITVKQFKDIIQNPENAEILEKFENSKGSAVLDDEQASYFLELDKLAKQNIDARYPEWEAEHMDTYNLDMYNLPERAKIYQKWKDLNKNTMYQQARELTSDEVDMEFGLPKLKQALAKQKEGGKLITAFNSVRKAIPVSEQEKLDKELLDILTNSDEKMSSTEIKQIIGYYGAKNQLNQLAKGKLSEIENGLVGEDKNQLDSELDNLIVNKYVDIYSGLPQVVKKPKEAIADLNSIIAKYQPLTQKSNWNQNIGSVKQVSEITKQIINNIKEINSINPDIANNLKAKFIGSKNTWQRENILGQALIDELNTFLTYSNQVKDDAKARANAIADINNKYADPAQADQRNAELAAIKNKPMLNTDAENSHSAWLSQVQSIENPKSNSETDKSYWTAITNKISRLVKNDPHAANGYHKEFEALINSLEAKYPDPKSPEIENALSNFLDTVKDETKGFGTVSKALASAI
ncbi:MAG: hypothetical protein J5691_01260 [Bacilli bacterium]|nr:hypothetical protein [Bacilli bacterium]